MLMRIEKNVNYFSCCIFQSQVPRQSSTETEAVPGSQDRNNVPTGIMYYYNYLSLRPP